MARINSEEKLRKDLRLVDVFAISTGAMFSSGFFLLPGLASATAGPAVVLAYFLAALVILPALLSKAELATAMPRAGGTYYFLDRSLGPAAGTIGGIGIWLALILKSAFALIGMGAYLALFLDVPITTLAVVLTVVFTVVNVVGAKQTSRFQVTMVAVLLAVLTFFMVQGLAEVFSLGVVETAKDQFTPFLPFGTEGLFTTVGLVFVSYAGLTKVASVAEEVANPDKNIPLGMFLSLAVATLFYVVGVYIMVSVLDPNLLREDLVPVATAAEAFFDWLPGSTGLIIIVIAAVAAFASTGNAGIMSASRYLLAMSRDRIIWSRFAELGRFRTPTLSLAATAVVMILCLVTLDVMSVAKLASAFQLIIFALMNVAVIVMRESHIEGYDPGFCSPFYPWIQIAGTLVALWLVTLMGTLTILFSFGIVVIAGAWYHYYASKHMAREGAIFHLFERLGRQRDLGLDQELREILKEERLGGGDPFDEVVTHAQVIDIQEPAELETVVWRVAAKLGDEFPIPTEDLAEQFLEECRMGFTPVARGAALPHLRLAEVRMPYLVLVRTSSGIPIRVERGEPHDTKPVHAFFFLISPEEASRSHLKILSGLATRSESEGFLTEWLDARNEQELKEAVLHDERFLSLEIKEAGPTADLAGKEVREISLEEGALIALVHRNGKVVIPRGRTELNTGDRLTILGSPDAIRKLRRHFLEKFKDDSWR